VCKSFGGIVLIPFTGRRKSFVEVKKKQDEKVTLMFMRGPDKPIKDISVSSRLLRIGAAALSFLFLSGVATTSYIFWDYQNLRYLKEENRRLEATNQSQAEKIKELQGLAEAMKGKLATIEDLDNQVREKVGLEEPENKEEERQPDRKVAGVTVSRSSSVAGELIFDESNPYEELDTLEDLKQELLDMDIKMTQQAEALLKLQDEVDKQLAFEAAKPNHWPMQGRLTSRFGMRKNPTGRGKEMHTGIDIANSTGTKIYAAGDGIVTFAGYKSGWGRMVLISHGYGYVSQYAHCSTLLVKEGQKIKKGDLIAKCGTSGRVTGPHLHFGIQMNGEWIDPLTVLE